MDLNRKPLKWDDLAAQHDPDSLPFWRFYEEVKQAQHTPRFAERIALWLKGRDLVEEWHPSRASM